MVREGARQPIPGRVAWYGRELGLDGDWVRRLDQRQVSTLQAALDHADRLAIPTLEIRREDFPLPGFDGLVADIREELENGRGMVRLTGLPVERFSVEGLRRLFWGLGTHLGTAVHQNSRGELIGEVRDESADAQKTYTEPVPGKVASARARARSMGPLRFHTDRADVIGLLCARNGMAGGVSKLASVATIHNEILARRPDLLDVLFQDFWRTRPEDEDGLHAERTFRLPVFGMVDGKITTQYSRTYVEQAQELSEVPRVTPAQVEAMDLLAEVAEETCLHAPFAEGDMQFLNNHVIYHGRTAYEDDKSSGRARLLLRIWLSMPDNRALPDGFDVMWGATAPNTLRGGVPLRA